MTEVKEMKKLSFKDVHTELEMENTFLKKNHDIKDFKKKADFLHSSGFRSSIATRLYGSISEKHDIIQMYNEKYHGQYKFILEPQLERICEKYNLFVRDVELFIGDIPEKNIKDMMNFQLHYNDVPEKKRRFLEEDVEVQRTLNERMKTNVFAQTMKMDHSHGNLVGIEKTLALNHAAMLDALAFRFKKLQPSVCIAAVKDLFSPIAFKESNARIITQQMFEASAKGQVDIDPIVMYKTDHGYIVITAWGDEANDELILNANHN